MFPLLGTGQVIALLLAGAFAAPMLVRPTHRGGPLMFAREFEVNADRWPAVWIVAEHAGLAPWLLRVINLAPLSCLELGATMMVCHVGGVFRPRTGPIELANIKNASAECWHPTYHITAM